jgi:thiol-disulfide isomerase/thioredoxin
MRKTPAIWGLVTACLLASNGSAWAVPSVDDMLKIKPKFDDVAISDPTAEELRDCKVEEVVSGGKKVGFVLMDGRKQLVRRYLAGKDPAHINIWSFYRDGVEVFRQIDSNLNKKVDQYRWLGTAGLKWGIDRDEDGKIDTWYMISADEVAHEAFVALSSGDFERLKALYITPAEIQELNFPAAAAAKMVQAQEAAMSKFQQMLAKQANLLRASFLRVESAAPGCWLAEGVGTPKDVIKFASRSVLYESADKKHDWFQTGEIIQVGHAWRLVDVAAETDAGNMPINNPQLNKLLADLSDLEKKITDASGPNLAQPNLVVAALYEQRAVMTEQIVAVVKENSEKETWYKQLLDSLSSAVIAGSEGAKARLAKYRERLVLQMPGSNLAAYAVYRELWSQYSPKLATPDGLKVQEAYHEQLAKFVKDYPKSEDTADALHQLGMGCEFAGTKEKDEEAANWYRAIYKNFPEHHLAEWAKGAERRVKLTGNPLELAGTQLNNTAFDINQLKNRVVVVYYWASHCTTCPADFARLKQALSTQKEVELVCVNLDMKAESAAAFLQQHPLQAFHVSQAAKDQNGLRGSLATSYGINVLPTVFLVGRDGRVINPKLQLADMEDALKKAQQ